MKSFLHRLSAAFVVGAFVVGCSGSGTPSVSSIGLRNTASHVARRPRVTATCGYSLTPSANYSEASILAAVAGNTTNGNSLLQLIWAGTKPKAQTAPLPSAGVPAVISRVYDYDVPNGSSFSPNPAAPYVAYDVQYQNPASPAPSPTGAWPQPTKGPNGESLYTWGPGSLDSAGSGTLSAVGNDGQFLGDLGEAMLLASSAGEPTGYFSSPLADGKTVLEHADSNLDYMMEKSSLSAAYGDTGDTNRIFRYADAYFLMGDALATLGTTNKEVNDGCAAILQSVVFLQNGLTTGNTAPCLDGDAATYPEFPGTGSPASPCSTPGAEFDSNYQGVSLELLLLYYMNMPSGGIQGTTKAAPAFTSTVSVSEAPSDVFPGVVHGMNKEGTVIKYTTTGGSVHSAQGGFCYASSPQVTPPPWPISGAESTFAYGEVSQCGNTRVCKYSYSPSPRVCQEDTADAIDVNLALQFYGFLFDRQGSGPTWKNISTQVSGWYTTNAASPGADSTADPYQPYYL
jgi:hypothetical protein